MHLTIDDKEVEVPKAQTILEEALDNGIYNPHPLCYHPDLKPAGT
ncbi:MAG: (2Fe-2S)-binding protein [Deltaproteobacteria bacterium]|nr:(2Fe-2S)-binding protein [Deltaproteobacteria bacterium]